MAASSLAMARLPLASPRHDEATTDAIISPSRPPLLTHHAADPPHTMMLSLLSYRHHVHTYQLHLYAVAVPVRVASTARTWSGSPSPCH